MSVFVKGMKMPKDKPIRIVLNPNGQLFIDHGVHFTEYEAVELPPHGRLIDADALIDAIESTDWYHQAPNKEMVHGANSAEHQAWYKEQDVYSVLENAPTVIESEEET